MIDLYRFYDDRDSLLYVGISLHAATRASEHRHDKAWWPDVATMTVEHLKGSRHDALAVECAAIRAEQPRHNVTHNPPVPLPAIAEFDALTDVHADTLSYEDFHTQAALVLDGQSSTIGGLDDLRCIADRCPSPWPADLIGHTPDPRYARHAFERRPSGGGCGTTTLPILVVRTEGGVRASYTCWACSLIWLTWWQA